ncbi:hypothetical protein H0H92_015579, partial [Tricholoma furcatifolium]
PPPTDTPANIIRSSRSSTFEPLPPAEHHTLGSAFAYQIPSKPLLLFHADPPTPRDRTSRALAEHACDELLWEVIEGAWLVILATIAVGTGSGIDTVLVEVEESV